MRIKYADPLIGKRFGLWHVARPAPNRYGHRCYTCQCDCGTIRVVTASKLQRGLSQSCGCVGIEKLIARNTIHGEAVNRHMSREYRSWVAAKQRCYNPNRPDYKDYGGRGIRMCRRWLHSYSNFLADMGRCPPGYTLDRRDNDGDYTPENCRWAPPDIQAQNRRKRAA